VGRTARASASGLASAFCAPEEADLLRAIEKLTRAPLPRAEVPREGEVFKMEQERAGEGRSNQGVPPHRRPGAAGPSRRTATRRKPGVGHAHGHNRGGHTPVPAADGAASSSGGAPRKPTLVGSWGPKKRR
jgi:ATP-dependent RNA helicase RhlE